MPPSQKIIWTRVRETKKALRSERFSYQICTNECQIGAYAFLSFFLSFFSFPSCLEIFALVALIAFFNSFFLAMM